MVMIALTREEGGSGSMTPVVSFVALAYAISWLIWLPLVAAQLGWVDAAPSRYLHLVGGLGPLLAAGVVARAFGGRPTTGRLVRNGVRWRVPIQWHLIAWLAPVALYFLAALIVRPIWGAWPEISRFGESEEFAELPLLVYWAANLLCYGWGEEVGWRGLLLPMLQDRMSAMKATLVITPVWAVWHLPLFFFVDSYLSMGVGGGVGWVLSLFTGAVLMTWLFNSTQGSILIVAVFHGTIDIVFNSPSPGDLATVLGVLITLWGLGIIVTQRWSDLSGHPRQTLRLGDAGPGGGRHS